MAEVTVNKISTDIVENYSEQDLNLISSFDVISQFQPKSDLVEFSIYNEQNLFEFINYNYIDYTVTLDYNTKKDAISTVNVDPEKDLIKNGYEQGNYTVVYNFIRNQISSSQDNPFYIKEISSDRTEIRIANNNISDSLLEKLVNDFRDELENSPYFEDFELNFGNNNIFLANNILIDNTSQDQYTVLIKLYEPLDSQFIIKDTLVIILQTAEEVSYNVNFPPQVIPVPLPTSLRGPNFNLNQADLTNNSTVFIDKATLSNSNNSNDLFSGSFYQLKNILNNKGITPNIDYSDFNDFIYFSSAEQRVRNFYYKVDLIENYSSELGYLDAVTGAQKSGSVAYYQNLIENVIENFDEFEHYQYYSSGSLNIYPKTNTTYPYVLASTGSTEALSWLEDQATNSGSAYDLENVDSLVNSLPSYVQDDSRNIQFLLFMDMIGQHFDDIWAYTKDVSNRFDADNRLAYGISKDIVADAIKSMGVNLYQNNFSSDDVLYSLTGINPGGGTTLPTGSYLIENIVSASNDPSIPDNINKEIYKRIFHNLPLLLKQKGSIAGLRTLINTFGIPDTILGISEFGGEEKKINSYNYFQNKFNYSVYNSGSSISNAISAPWTLNTEWDSFSDNPQSLIFRFKPDNILPEGDEYSLVNFKDGEPFHITLAYTGSGYTSSSYGGSIPSSSNDYATLTLWDNTTELATLSAPFYNGDWWDVLVTRTGVATNATVDFRIANSIYNGSDGFEIGFTTGKTVVDTFASWISTIGTPILYIPAKDQNGLTLGGDVYYGLTGSFQEVRFYNEVIDEFTFLDYAMNPYSIKGINFSSSADNLAFRAPLGSDLITNTGSLTSIHPKVTGSLANITSSFQSDSNYMIGDRTTPSTPSDLIFIPQTEFIYSNQPSVGIKNRVSDKVRLKELSLSGNTLSPLRSIQQNYLTHASQSYTNDNNLLEIAFSPQNKINDDINSSMGYFNIGEYIGDPRQIMESVTSYPQLDYLRDTYFKKYYKNYDWVDFVKLIKYFDNSLFKMIQDFTPAKASLTTGVVIKQHILERNKQRPPITEVTQSYYTGSINSGFTKGGQAGTYDALNFPTSSNEFKNGVSPQITQSWNYQIETLSGSLVINQSTQDEFYNGELSGSNMLVTNGDLNNTRVVESANINTGFIAPYDTIYQGTIPGFNQGVAGYELNTVNGLISVTKITLDGKDANGVSRFNYLTTYPNTTYKAGDTLYIKTSGDGNVYPFHVESVEQGPTVSGNGSTTINITPWNVSNYSNEWYPGDGVGPQTMNFEIINDPSITNQEANLLGDYPLLNNVSDSRLSNVYQDIDYSTNSTIPVNYDALKNDAALRAAVQDSNYSQNSWINNRYNGTRVSSVNFNMTTER